MFLKQNMIKVLDFNIYSETKLNVVIIKFQINNSNFISYPCSFDNIDYEITSKFKKVLDGKDTVICLNVDDKQSNFITFTNGVFIIDTVNSSSMYESHFVFENNSIVRNEIRRYLNS